MSTQLQSRALRRTLGGFDQTVLAPISHRARWSGYELVDLASLGIMPTIAGGAQGFHTLADVVTQTIDGRDLNDIWAQLQRMVEVANEPRDNIMSFVSRRVANPVEEVAVATTDDFEEASEFGVPHAARTPGAYFQMGYTFKWYDLSTRYTWQFLAEATSQQINADANTVLEADNRLMFTQVLKTIFNNVNLTATIKGNAYNVYKFYNADGTVPPSYRTTTFNSSHNHFITNAQNALAGDGSATSKAVRPLDLELLIQQLTHHGYTEERGFRLVVMVNTQEANTIRGFKAGTASATYDFIPAQNQPGLFLPSNQILVNGQPPSTVGGLPVTGKYGPALIVTDDYIPANYMFAFATGGPDNIENPVGIREHANANLRGLRLVKGRASNEYPLIESTWVRGFGTGIRQRGAGAVMQVNTASTTYAIPTAYQ